MKKLLSILLSLLMICAVLPGGALAQTQTESDFVIKDGVLKKYTGTDAKVIVPDGITKIGISAFYKNKTVTEVVLPNSIKEIDDYSFSACGNLRTINFPDGLQRIGWHSFSRNYHLNHVVIPDSVTTIKGNAFYRCDRLEDLVIPKTLTDFSYSTFDTTLWYKKTFADADFRIINGVLTGVSNKIKNQEKIVIPDDVITLSGTLFADYSPTTGRLESNETVKEVILPDSLTKMESTFKGCVNLNNVKIPKSVQEISGAAFSGCKSITEIILPEGINYVSNSLCIDCTNLEKVVLPETVTEIRGNAFSGCKNLKEINIPHGVTKIEHCAFEHCVSLEKIVLPDTLVSIGYMTFWCCDKLSEIRIPPSLTDIDDYAFELTPWFENSRDENGLVIVNHVLLEYGILKNNILYIPDGVVSFVCGRYNAKAVVIPPSVTDLSKFTYGDGRIGIVYGVPGSYAEQEAKKYNKTFHAIALNRSSLSLTNGKSYQLSFNSGSDAIWKSSDSKIVSVDQNGKITAKKNGAATITATLYGKKYTCKVTVGAKTYTVKRGDTLWAIAAKQLGSGYRYKEIMKLNGLKSTKIVSGQRLKLPER